MELGGNAKLCLDSPSAVSRRHALGCGPDGPVCPEGGVCVSPRRDDICGPLAPQVDGPSARRPALQRPRLARVRGCVPHRRRRLWIVCRRGEEHGAGPGRDDCQGLQLERPGLPRLCAAPGLRLLLVLPGGVPGHQAPIRPVSRCDGGAREAGWPHGDAHVQVLLAHAVGQHHVRVEPRGGVDRVPLRRLCQRAASVCQGDIRYDGVL
mmetsp:Transcript_7102/g.18049  ORF Transcript_7102/g.18049 Transcript_7102/m.18049 type:complete len:208 (+) Transcript_7102:460-1083(+)